MGCTNSKEDIKKGKKGKKGQGKGKGKKGQKKKRDEEEEDDEEDFAPIVLVDVDAKPEKIRKEINKVYKMVTEKRDKLKTTLRPFLAERRGINQMLEEEKERLLGLLEQKNQLEKEKDNLMEATLTKDVDEIFRCYETKDKPGLVNVIIYRNKAHLKEICRRYEDKYGEPLQVRLATEGTRFLGAITGSLTNFSKLLLYRVMSQDERDAGFLREFTTKGMSIQDENILEVLLTRTNKELAAALDYHADEYGKSLREILSSHSYKNYRDFISKVLECNRDEKNEPFDDGLALKYANELYEAGAGRTIGINPEPFIRILSVASKAQIDSINEKYKDKKLMKDIDAKLGGDFAMAVKIRCTDKYEYLASRIAEAMKSFSKDKDCLCRILGSLSRPECVKLRDAYDKADSTGARSLEATLKAALSGEANFLKACLALISGDLSLCPTGSDKEPDDDEAEMALAGRRAHLTAEDHYNRQAVFDRGEAIKKEKKITEDDELPNFEYDDRCRGTDLAELSQALKEVEETRDILDRYKEVVKDEIIATKETYFAIHSHCYETETWIGTLRSHVSNLRIYDARRDSGELLSNVKDKKKR